MPLSQYIAVKKLSLDLGNFRTVPQQNEDDAIRAMISIHPEWFWSLTESVLDTGYLPTENIIVLKNAKGMVVKEGNRRVAAIKLILGILNDDGMAIPSHIEQKISLVSSQWKKENGQLPCTIYAAGESGLVDRIVTLTHGKSERAGRDHWNAVASARHNRDVNKETENGLDLLEAFLRKGRKPSPEQRERWAGMYPVTVLDEAIKRNAKRFGVQSARELVTKYPKISHRLALEEMMMDIGLEGLSFKMIRDVKLDILASKYKVPATSLNPSGTSGNALGNTTTPTPPLPTTPKKPNATAADDHRSVTKALLGFNPKGSGREKVVSLLHELRTLKIKTQPLAFCFVLRSMFELSAKAYCKDHKTDGLSAVKADGYDKSLVDVLRDITNFLVLGPDGKPSKVLQNVYHGPMSELAKPSGFLSVTSMNQLVHNPKFLIDDTHISTLFGNIFPLLEAMNL